MMFRGLIAPLSGDEFFEQFWTQKEVFLRGQPDRFHETFNWSRFTDLLNAHWHDLAYPALRLVLAGKVVPERRYSEFVTTAREGTVRRKSSSKAIELCREGATMVVNGVNKRDGALGEMSFQLAKELGHIVQINAYYSQPNHQGFDFHYDPHEIFIAQIEGKKNWRVGKTTLKCPLQSQRYFNQQPPPASDATTYNLTPGDVLYLPRGVWHEAVAIESPSLHLTIGIYCSKKINFATWLIERLEEEEFFRENLYCRALASDFSNGDEEKIIDALAAYFSSLRGRGSELLSEYHNSCDIADRMYPQPFSLPL